MACRSAVAVSGKPAMPDPQFQAAFKKILVGREHLVGHVSLVTQFGAHVIVEHRGVRAAMIADSLGS